MTSKLYGVACCATFCITIAAYSSILGPVADQTAKGGTLGRQIAQFDWAGKESRAVVAEKATSLAAVGWEGCPWCERFKADTLPDLVAEGYDARYVDLADWEGPKVTTGPTLFFMVGDKIVKVHKGYLTPDQVKEYLRKPSLK